MKTDSFSKEKHLPVRRFIADESKVATGLYGPLAIADDIDNIHAMFDPEAELLGGEEKGGIGAKNIQDGAVSYRKLSEDVTSKIDEMATRQEMDEAIQKIDTEVDGKAGQADTLSGYGIEDAYTKLEVNSMLSPLQHRQDSWLATKAKTIVEAINEVHSNFVSTQGVVDRHTIELEKKVNNTDASLETTNKSIVGAINEVNANTHKKTEETLIGCYLVDTPAWDNQPTFTGPLLSDFTVDDFYYVTVTDSAGNPLPADQFMLKDFYASGSRVYEQIFTLPGLNTGGSAVLEENDPVEFTSVGSEVKLRTAGVNLVTQDLAMDGFTGKLTVKVVGEFIKYADNQYFSTMFRTSNAVASYQSGHINTANKDSTTEIWHYNGVDTTAYKVNSYSDIFSLEKIDDNQFYTHRDVFLRYLPYGTTTYKNWSQHSTGHGKVLQENTKINKVTVAAANARGYLKNGTVITVTEVK